MNEEARRIDPEGKIRRVSAFSGFGHGCGASLLQKPIRSNRFQESDQPLLSAETHGPAFSDRTRVPPVLLYTLRVGAATHLYHPAPECLRLTGRYPKALERVEAHMEARVSMFLGREDDAPKRKGKRA